MKQQLSTRTRLRPGQTMHCHADRGLIVVAAEGTIRLATASALPAEQAMRKTVDLHEGEAHVVQEEGWLAISARHPAEIVCIAGETWWQALSQRCPGLIVNGMRWWRSLAASLFTGPTADHLRRKS